MQDVFVRADGQDDNLGDSALRRGLLDGIRGVERTLHVLLPRNSKEYVRGLQLAASDCVYSTADEWHSAMRKSRRPSLVLNPGEANPRHTLIYPGRLMFDAVLRVRLRNGALIQSGVGIQRPVGKSLLSPPLLHLFDIVAWRDPVTCDHAGIGEVYPDWAFALGTPTSKWSPPSERSLLVVTLRGDRPEPSVDWLTRVAEFARNHNLKIVICAQVGRDAARAEWLAVQLQCEYFKTNTTDHLELDNAIRALFGKAQVIISDRVHALIIGATEGAVPIGSSAGSPEKLQRTLAPANLNRWATNHADFKPEIVELEQTFEWLAKNVDEARNQLAKLRQQIDTVLKAKQ